MGKKTTIGIPTLTGLIVACFFLYSTFIGFERDSLAEKLPADTYATLSVRHLRKVGLAFATDNQLQASAQVIQGIAKILGDSIPSFDFPGDDPEIDATLLRSLGNHFKTQLTLAALPPPPESREPIEFAILADFYGSSDDLSKTLQELAKQASTPSLELHWSLQHWQETQYQTLSISSPNDSVEIPPIELSWAVYNETLYLCSHRESLERLLLHAATPEAPSLLDSLQEHNIESYAPAADITLFANAHPCLKLLTKSIQKDLIQNGGLAASFNPLTFAKALKLDNIESLAIAISLTGKRSAYSGIRYSETVPILDTLSAASPDAIQPPSNTPIYAAESINLDIGDVLLKTKTAFLKAAPLANFPYFGIRSQIKAKSGLDIEDVLSNSFLPHITSLHTLDFGVGKNAFGEIQERVVFDSAYKFKLKENNALPTLIDSLKPILLDSQRITAYDEDNILHIDKYRDSTLTSDRFALSYSTNYITIGYGTLKSFEELQNQPMPTEPNNETPSASNEQVGYGFLTTSKLPTTLFQLAAVLYQQVNNTTHIPQAFLDFDWGSLAILEQNRISATYHDQSGHLFRVSQQVN